MDNDHSNYELLENLVANNKKAKVWTTILVVILFVLAGVVFKFYLDIREKNATIIGQGKMIVSQHVVIAKLDTFLAIQNSSIDNIRRKYETSINSKIDTMQQKIVAARLGTYDTKKVMQETNVLLLVMGSEFRSFVDSIKTSTGKLRDQYIKSESITELDKQ